MATESPRPWTAPPSAELPPADGSADVPPRMPTGVPDFDFITGGIPAGSVILLVGQAGSGHIEFALTSAVHLMLRYDDPRLHEFFLGSARGPFAYPAGIAYVSLTRSKEQTLAEIAGSFDRTYHDVLARHLTFQDLSPAYFADSVVPPSWSSLEGSLLTPPPNGGGRSPTALSALADAVEASGEKNLVIVDSLTDLVARKGIESEELLTLVKGLRRRAKAWNGLVYLLLSRGVAPAAVENALFDSVDGVLSFSWTSSPTHSRRHRAMTIEKSMPVLARVPVEQQGRFVIEVGHVDGLVTTQYERI